MGTVREYHEQLFRPLRQLCFCCALMTAAVHLIEFETARPDYRNPTIEVHRASLTCLTGSFLVCSFCPREGLKAMAVAAVQLPADIDAALLRLAGKARRTAQLSARNLVQTPRPCTLNPRPLDPKHYTVLSACPFIKIPRCSESCSCFINMNTVM